ncbi:MAG: short-chain dehydrogenase [Solirubrobacterales bacterium]|nr:short-chain dehydrogenase [Solirubrobacterales bacterium]
MTLDNRALAGRTIAIAGANGSLGPYVARAVAAAGATVALTDRDLPALEILAAELGVPAERVDCQVVDLMDEAATRKWAASVRSRFGGVDGLLHLVGGWRGGKPLATAPAEDWEVMHQLLVRTVQNTSRAFYEALNDSGCGRYAIIGARQAAEPSHKNAAYATAKAAAEAWTFALADAFAEADHGATANVVAINALVTPEQRTAEPDKAFKTFTDAEDIADTLVWLCSDAAGKTNGQRIALYGR